MPRRRFEEAHGVPTPQEMVRHREQEEARQRSLPPKDLDEESETKLSQFLDEDDHKKCVAANKKALLAEKLERLRALKVDIANENWMFVTNNNVTSFSGWKTES